MLGTKISHPVWHFWKWCSFSQGGIYKFPGGYVLIVILQSYRKEHCPRVPSIPGWVTGPPKNKAICTITKAHSPAKWDQKSATCKVITTLIGVITLINHLEGSHNSIYNCQSPLDSLTGSNGQKGNDEFSRKGDGRLPGIIHQCYIPKSSKILNTWWLAFSGSVWTPSQGIWKTRDTANIRWLYVTGAWNQRWWQWKFWAGIRPWFLHTEASMWASSLRTSLEHYAQLVVISCQRASRRCS